MVLDPYGRYEEMTQRFNVKPASVDQFADDFVGFYIEDAFTGHPVRDGKGGFIHVWGSRVALVAGICEEMNARTSGISEDESDAFSGREEPIGLLAA